MVVICINNRTQFALFSSTCLGETKYRPLSCGNYQYLYVMNFMYIIQLQSNSLTTAISCVLPNLFNVVNLIKYKKIFKE